MNNDYLLSRSKSLCLAAIKPEGFLLIEFGAPVYPGYSTDLIQLPARIY
jgi:hypothetical protein